MTNALKSCQTGPLADQQDVSRPELTSTLAVRPSRFGYSLGIGLICAFAAGKAVLSDSLDPDFFWHIRVADQLLTQGIGPVVDNFSFMSNKEPWTPFSWLGELWMKWIYDATGLRGIVATHVLCSVAFFYFMARACREMCLTLTGEHRQLATFFACVAGALFSLPYLSFRPVTMALALMAAMVFILHRDRRVADWRVWLLVPMTLVLTNLHLYVILWVVFLWARWVGMALDAWNYLPGPDVQQRTEEQLLHGVRRKRTEYDPRDVTSRYPLTRQFALAIGCSLAALCTPMLPGCIRNAIWFQGEDPMVLNRLVSEILPFHTGAIGKVLLAIVVLQLLLVFRTLVNNRLAAQSSASRPAGCSFGFEHLFTLVAAIGFLLQMGRLSTVYALFAMPLLAAQLPAMRDAILDRTIVRLTLAGSLAFCLMQIALAFPKSDTRIDDWITRHDDNLRYPTRAAEYLQANVTPTHGRVLNELTWGGYLIWRLGDQYQVFMDGRTLIYPASFWNDLYLRDEQTKIDLLRSQNADAAILPASASRLAQPLKQLGWTAVYADDRAVIWLPPIPQLSNTKE